MEKLLMKTTKLEKMVDVLELFPLSNIFTKVG